MPHFIDMTVDFVSAREEDGCFAVEYGLGIEIIQIPMERRGEEVVCALIAPEVSRPEIHKKLRLVK